MIAGFGARLNCSHFLKLLFCYNTQTYSSWGYHIVFAILRRQYKHVNKLELNEQEDKLQTTEMLVEKRRQQRKAQQQS